MANYLMRYSCKTFSNDSENNATNGSHYHLIEKYISMQFYADKIIWVYFIKIVFYYIHSS